MREEDWPKHLRFLKPDDVVRLSGMGKSLIYRLIAEKVIPSVRIGKSIRVSVQAFEDWVGSLPSGANPEKKP